MKKVVTMVGTSIFENYVREIDDQYLGNDMEDLKEKAAEEYKENDPRIKRIKSKLEKWISEFSESDKEELSAEIKSLVKLKERFKEDFEVYLLYSDTAMGKLAAEIIRDVLQNMEIFKDSEIKKPDCINNLQIQDNEKFIIGMNNLIHKFYDEIATSGWGDNVIINITGGYKATIPYLTILGQVNKSPIFYIFEDTDALIEIPYLPLDIKWDLFEKYEDLFLEFNKEGIIEREEELPYNVKKELEGLIEVEGKLLYLNSFGLIFWEKYKEKYFFYYASEETQREIEKQLNIKKILQTKFWDKQIREGKTELKNGHYVYDDGNNRYRIFYIEKDGRIYIYKTFEDYGDYRYYLENVKGETVKFEDIKANSKLWKIIKER